MRTFIASWLWIMGAWIGRYSEVIIRQQEAEGLYALLIIGVILSVAQDVRNIFEPFANK